MRVKSGPRFRSIIFILFVQSSLQFWQMNLKKTTRDKPVLANLNTFSTSQEQFAVNFVVYMNILLLHINMNRHHQRSPALSSWRGSERKIAFHEMLCEGISLSQWTHFFRIVRTDYVLCNALCRSIITNKSVNYALYFEDKYHQYTL